MLGSSLNKSLLPGLIVVDKIGFDGSELEPKVGDQIENLRIWLKFFSFELMLTFNCCQHFKTCHLIHESFTFHVSYGLFTFLDKLSYPVRQNRISDHLRITFHLVAQRYLERVLEAETSSLFQDLPNHQLTRFI